MECCSSRKKGDPDGGDGKLTGFSRLMAWMGSNAIPQDVGEATAKLKEVSPKLLQPGETIDMAFKIERDHFYFTSLRVLLRNKGGFTGKKVTYTTVPYSAIKAFYVETAGARMDNDSELMFWASGIGSISLNFVKDRVDALAVQRYFASKILPGGEVDAGDVGAHISPEAISSPNAPALATSDDFWSLLGSDAKQVDAAEVEALMTRDPAVLQASEKVQLAFKCGRDLTLFTTKRILFVDVKGFSGTKIQYRTVMWKSIRAFAVQTAGSWDRDAEVTLYTNIPEMRAIKQDLRNGKADVVAVKRFLSNMVLGLDTAPETSEKPSSFEGQEDKGTTSFFEWAGDDARQIDEKKADHQFHSSPPILQGCEHVEMAFKGRRDMLLFTTKRLVFVDIRGWSGQRVKYVSIPYSTVQMFAVRSAGSFDKDSEMVIWTDIMHEPKGDNQTKTDEPDVASVVSTAVDVLSLLGQDTKGADQVTDDQPQPGMAMLEQDFAKDKVDLMAVHRYLSAKCITAGRDSASDAAKPEPLPPDILAKSPPGAFDDLLSWLGQDAKQVDAKELDKKMHEGCPLLPTDEHVVVAFNVGRDTTLFTNRRVMFIDKQGLTGSRIEYLSAPYTSLRAFSVESAGSWDRDAEIKLHVNSWWKPTLQQDLRKGFGDIMFMQRFLSNTLFGEYDGISIPTAPPPAVPGEAGDGQVQDFLAWLGGDAHEIPAEEVDQRLRSSPAILLDDEKVDSAYKVGRDMWVLTAKRILIVNVKGWSGNKVEYESVPLRFCRACTVTSAGSWDWDAESTVYTDVPAMKGVGTDLRKGKVDIFSFEAAVAAKVIHKPM